MFRPFYMGDSQDKIAGSVVYVRDFAFEATTPTKRQSIGMANSVNIAEVNAKSFSELLSGPVVDIYVGQEKQHWALHRNLLTYHSEYLHSELEPPQLNDGSPPSKKKSTSQRDELRLDLLEQDPAGFELFIKWVYQSVLDDVDDISDDQAKYEYTVACHKLYSLCSKLEMPALKNLAIDQYRKGLHSTSLVPDAEEINQIYRDSPRGSPFRKLMTKIAARQIMDPDSDKDAESYRQCFESNPDFCIDLVNAIKDGTGGLLFDDPTSGDECEFHDHSDGPNCHVKKKRPAEPAPSPPKLNGALESIAPWDKKTQQRPFRPPSQPPEPPPPTTPSVAKPASSSSPNDVPSSPALRGSSPPTPPPSPPKHPKPPVTPQRSVSFAVAPSSRPPATPTPGRAVSALPGGLTGILKQNHTTPTPPPKRDSTAITGRPAPFITPNQQQPRSTSAGGTGAGAGSNSAPAKSYAAAVQQQRPVLAKSPVSSPILYSTPSTSVTSTTSISSADGTGRKRPPKLRRGPKSESGR